MSFRNDLNNSKKAVKFVISHLERAGMAPQTNEAKDYPTLLGSDVSASLGNRQFLIEVKFDLKALESQNIAIEHWNPRLDKASGVTATKSELWVHVLREPTLAMSAYVCSVVHLLAHVEYAEAHRKIERAGDGNASIKLYHAKEILEAIFHRFDHLPGEMIRILFRELLGDSANEQCQRASFAA